MALSMPCAYCEAKRTVIAAAIWDRHFKTIRRFRRCPKCDYRWSTLEMDLDQATLLVSLSKEAPGRPESPSAGTSLHRRLGRRKRTGRHTEAPGAFEDDD